MFVFFNFHNVHVFFAEKNRLSLAKKSKNVSGSFATPYIYKRARTRVSSFILPHSRTYVLLIRKTRLANKKTSPSA